VVEAVECFCWHQLLASLCLSQRRLDRLDLASETFPLGFQQLQVGAQRSGRVPLITEHVPSDEEREPAEHLLLGGVGLAAHLLPDAISEFLVVRHDGIVRRGATVALLLSGPELSDVDHPRHTELVDAHAELVAPPRPQPHQTLPEAGRLTGSGPSRGQLGIGDGAVPTLLLSWR
jgi:hypothetical protein